MTSTKDKKVAVLSPKSGKEFMANLHKLVKDVEKSIIAGEASESSINNFAHEVALAAAKFTRGGGGAKWKHSPEGKRAKALKEAEEELRASTGKNISDYSEVDYWVAKRAGEVEYLESVFAIEEEYDGLEAKGAIVFELEAQEGKPVFPTTVFSDKAAAFAALAATPNEQYATLVRRAI